MMVRNDDKDTRWNGAIVVSCSSESVEPENITYHETDNQLAATATRQNDRLPHLRRG